MQIKTFAQMNKWGAEDAPLDAIFRRRGGTFACRIFVCETRGRKCDDREKEERKREGERELKGQLRLEKLGGAAAPFFLSCVVFIL